MNIFTNLFLATVILLSKSTCLREIFMFISQNSRFLRFSLNTHLTFQSCPAMLLLKTTELSFFTNRICAFATLTIIVPNFQYLTSKQTVLKEIHKNLEKLWIVWHSIFNMYTKLSCIIGIFINFSIHIFIIFLCTIFRIYFFHVWIFWTPSPSSLADLAKYFFKSFILQDSIRKMPKH